MRGRGRLRSCAIAPPKSIVRRSARIDPVIGCAIPYAHDFTESRATETQRLRVPLWSAASRRWIEMGYSGLCGLDLKAARTLRAIAFSPLFIAPRQPKTVTRRILTHITRRNRRSSATSRLAGHSVISGDFRSSPRFPRNNGFSVSLRLCGP